jgi:hypothetical protein
MNFEDSADRMAASDGKVIKIKDSKGSHGGGGAILSCGFHLPLQFRPGPCAKLASHDVREGTQNRLQ